MEIKNNMNLKYFFLVMILIVINLVACAGLGSVVITRPDEHRQIYEAKETIVLKAIAGVFKDKKMGSNVTINQEKHMVETDYIAEDNWRTKSIALVRKLNWKESEVVLSVFTEKKTGTGWEMRKLLGQDQYEVIFDAIELRIYEEMSKIE